jgi:hypothetical protein
VKYASNAKVTVKLQVDPAAPDATRSVINGRGFHSSTSQLSLSRFFQ